jgi:polysaccharide export outer membrane protein
VKEAPFQNASLGAEKIMSTHHRRIRSTLTALCSVTLLLASSATAFAQDPPTARKQPPKPSAPMPSAQKPAAPKTPGSKPAVPAISPPAAPDEEYQIGPGDSIKIEVAKVSTLGWAGRVSNSGKIHLPYLGILRVADLTTPQLEAKIAAALREQSLVNEPWVTVRVTEYRAQPVYVLGEVILPGQFVMTKEMYLTDLLALAGGFNGVASPIGYLYRRKPNAGNLPPGEVPTDEAIPIDFNALNEGLNPEMNLRLKGGDVLYCPEAKAQVYFVVGDVVHPGVASMQMTPNVTASEAIAKAGGPLRTAKMSKGVLVRFEDDGSRKEMSVDFDAILRGRQPDMQVRANDIIFVPGSTAKTVGYGLLGVVPQVVITQPASKVAGR